PTLTNGGFRNPPLVSVISYHVAEETIYTFLITSNDYQIQTIDKPANFTQLIADFQDAIALADIDEYIDSASVLFDLLLLPVLEEIQNASKLILIPHNELATVSFDALIDTRKLKAESRAKISADCDFSALPYLVKDYDISYHYSTTMLLHSVARQEQKRPQAASFVGFAPVSFDGSENTELALASSRGQTKVMRSNRAGERALATLPNTENEVKEVFQLFEEKELEAQAFLYASANKQNLFENALNHKYVLIATHGYVQNGNAGLSGIYLASKGEVSDTYNSYLLHTSEAYHLQLDAYLVVLSSCSSGVGKLVTGEGMMAINRGFLYAGASNIIFTQFDIPDASSGELVKRLFSCILEGETYASALRKAKLEVIQQSLKTPEDWAGYALIGG
ncbi:MAG: CHAT domain-containing protein, partial [Chitinophagales bacterium]